MCECAGIRSNHQQKPPSEAVKLPQTAFKVEHYTYVPINPYSAETFATYRRKLFARRARCHHRVLVRPEVNGFWRIENSGKRRKAYSGLSRPER